MECGISGSHLLVYISSVWYWTGQQGMSICMTVSSIIDSEWVLTVGFKIQLY